MIDEFLRLSGDSDCVEVVSETPERGTSPSDNGIKKKKKKKHKHKKHSSTDKNSSGHIKKHKKHKRKRSTSLTSDSDIKQPKIIDEKDDLTPEILSDKSGRYTPEPIKRKVPDVKSDNNIINGKEKDVIETLPSTDSSTVVEYLTEGLNKECSLEVVSSESEDAVPVNDDCDSVDIDVAVIEDDIDLEELMKQKELLQARLGEYMSDSEGTPTEPISETKKVPKQDNEIILLDDSSNDSFSNAKKTEVPSNRRVVVRREHSNLRRDERKRSRSFDRRLPIREKHRMREKEYDYRDKYKRDRSRSRSRDRLRYDRNIRDRERER